jgi:aryl-alcohol dehydrogenase-like predicted oxidoreductase
MNTRHLGNSDLSIATVGYGSWGVEGSGWPFGWEQQNDNDSVAAIVGARKLEQVDDMVASEDVHLTESDLTEIEAVDELAGRGQ